MLSLLFNKETYETVHFIFILCLFLIVFFCLTDRIYSISSNDTTLSSVVVSYCIR